MPTGFARRGGNQTQGVRNHGSCLPYTGNGLRKDIGACGHGVTWRTRPANELDNIEGPQEIFKAEDAKMSMSSSQKTSDVKGSWILFYRHWGVVSHLCKQKR